MSKEKFNSKAEAPQEGFLQKNMKKVMVCGVCVVACVFACVACVTVMNQRSAKAAEQLAACEQYFQQGALDKALDGDGQDCVGLLAVADQYGCTKSGNVAKLYAGLAYVQLDSLDEARKYLEEFDAQDDETVSPAAMMALGNVYIGLGQQEKGAETLVRAAVKAENVVISPVALLQAGEVFESLGKPEKALKVYEQIKSKYRNSVQGNEIDKYIERVSAK